MIIRPRMPRSINQSPKMGTLGKRTLQRSMTHIRRMLVSRVAEQSSADLQQDMEAPLNWDRALPDNQPPIMLESSNPEPRQPRRANPASTVQRQAEPSDQPAKMPSDLQAIFDLHKKKGRVDSNPEVARQADIFEKTGGAVVAKSSEPSTSPAPSLSSKPGSSSVQRETAKDVQRDFVDIAADDFPIVDPFPPARRVRSRVEYVGKDQPSSAPETSTAETSPSSAEASVQRSTETSASSSSESGGDDTDSGTGIESIENRQPDPKGDAVQAAIYRAEQSTTAEPTTPTSNIVQRTPDRAAPTPTTSSVVQRDMDADTDDYSEDLGSQTLLDTSTPASSRADSAQAAIQRAEGPSASSPSDKPSSSIPKAVQRDMDADAGDSSDTYTEDFAGQTFIDTSTPASPRADSVQAAIQRAEGSSFSPSDTSDKPSSSTPKAVQRDIDTDADDYSDDFVGQTFIDTPAPASSHTDSVQAAIQRAEGSSATTPSDKPSSSSTPKAVQRNIDADAGDYSDTYAEDFGSQTLMDTPAPASSRSDSVQAAIRRDIDADAGDSSDTYAEDFGSQTLMDTPAPASSQSDSIQAAIQRAEQSPHASSPSTQSVQRTPDAQPEVDIRRTEIPRPPLTLSSSQGMSISSPKAPTRIQRTPLPAFDDDSADDYLSDAVDMGEADWQSASQFSSEPSAQTPSFSPHTVQLARDDEVIYGEEPDHLPTQDVDLATALMGGMDTSSRSPQTVQRTPESARPSSESTVLPAIGRAAKPSLAPRTVQRTPEASVEAAIRRAEASSPSADLDDDVDYTPPSSQESGLLDILDMPTNTPVARGSKSSPARPASSASSSSASTSIQREVDEQPIMHSASVQREVTVDQSSSDPNESDSGSSAGGNAQEMAEKVYQIIKRKLRVEQERTKSKK